MNESTTFPESVDNPTVRKVEVPLDEMVEVYRLLENLSQFLHQPENFTREKMEAFLVEQGGYKRLASAYYDIMWKWLPPEVQDALLNR